MNPVKPNLGDNESELSNGVIAAGFRDAEQEGIGYVVTRWELSYAERQAVARGQDIFLIQATADDRVNSAMLVVGPEAFREALPDSSAETVPTDAEGDEDPARLVPRTTERL